jgi:hypothetical protein
MGERGNRGESGVGLPHEDRPTETTSDFDLSLVHADDEYLDLLGGGNLDDIDAPDDQLSALLMSWRRDVEAEPIGELIDEKLATVTVQAARLRRKRRPRLLVPVAAAAAVLAIAFAGVGLAARDAQPGDTLWALTKVLYADHARSVEAAEEVRADLREAQAALTEGDLEEAKSKLEDAHAALPIVSSEDGQDALERQHQSLLAQLPGNPSGEASQPPQPNPTTVPDSGTSDGSGTAPTSPSSPSEDTTAPTEPPPDTTAPTEPTDPPTSTTEATRSETSPEPAEPASSAGVHSLPDDEPANESPAVYQPVG